MIKNISLIYPNDLSFSQNVPPSKTVSSNSFKQNVGGDNYNSESFAGMMLISSFTAIKKRQLAERIVGSISQKYALQSVHPKARSKTTET